MTRLGTAPLGEPGAATRLHPSDNVANAGDGTARHDHVPDGGNRATGAVPAAVASLVGLLSATVHVVADVDRVDRHPALHDAIANAGLALQGMADTRLPMAVVEDALDALTNIAADVLDATS